MTRKAKLAVFIAALLIQVLIVAAIPARKVITRASGRTIVLKVRPVDPYSILSGYYVTLAFEISTPTGFPTPPELKNGDACYAVVERDESGVWRPYSLDRELPQELSENQAAIAGRVNQSRFQYGIENFFIPEAQRSLIEDDLRKNGDRAVVEVKVDSQGNAALVKLIIDDRVYR